MRKVLHQSAPQPWEPVENPDGAPEVSSVCPWPVRKKETLAAKGAKNSSWVLKCKPSVQGMVSATFLFMLLSVLNILGWNPRQLNQFLVPDSRSASQTWVRRFDTKTKCLDLLSFGLWRNYLSMMWGWGMDLLPLRWTCPSGVWHVGHPLKKCFFCNWKIDSGHYPEVDSGSGQLGTHVSWSSGEVLHPIGRVVSAHLKSLKSKNESFARNNVGLTKLC